MTRNVRSIKTPKVMRSERKAWELVIKHEGWLRQQTARHIRQLYGLDMNDLFQEVRLGAFHAARYWDPRKSTFTTYSHFWIHSAISECARKHAFWLPRNKGSRPQLLYLEDIAEIASPTESKEPGERTTEKAILQHTKYLPQRLRYVVEEWLAGNTLERTGEKMGVTRERVRQLRTKAVNRLRVAARTYFL